MMCGVSLLEMYSNTYFFKGWTDRLSSWVYESPGYSSRRERSRRRGIEIQEGRRELRGGGVEEGLARLCEQRVKGIVSQ